ncbi:hypothetical protein DENSPDRAFT_933666, partial [Dentipellis sp. KUC8613]
MRDSSSGLQVRRYVPQDVIEVLTARARDPGLVPTCAQLCPLTPIAHRARPARRTSRLSRSACALTVFLPTPPSATHNAVCVPRRAVSMPRWAICAPSRRPRAPLCPRRRPRAPLCRPRPTPPSSGPAGTSARHVAPSQSPAGLSARPAEPSRWPPGPSSHPA